MKAKSRNHGGIVAAVFEFRKNCANFGFGTKKLPKSLVCRDASGDDEAGVGSAPVGIDQHQMTAAVDQRIGDAAPITAGGNAGGRLR